MSEEHHTNKVAPNRGRAHRCGMGKTAPARPEWTADLGALIAAHASVGAICDGCDGWRDIDLIELAGAMGLEYDLWDRRTCCRITDGCSGWNRFYFDGRGRFEPMRGG